MANSMDTSRSTSKHTYLLLPFTEDLLYDPSPLSQTIYNSAYTSLESCTVLFSSPGTSQLYDTLRQSPTRHWHSFQTFLGRIYASLAAGQWEAGRVLMDVEILFDEDHLDREDWEGRLKYTGKGGARLLVLKGYEDLPLLAKIKPILGNHTTLILPGPIERLPKASSSHTLSDRNPSESLDSSSAPGGHIAPVSGSTIPPSSSHEEVGPPVQLPSQSGPAGPSAQPGPTGPVPGFPVTALGGTFDHLHAAHKLLLHLALFLTTKKLIVGVMAQHLLSSKSNFELLQPLSDRIGGVKEFLRRAAGKGRKGVELDVVEIQDPYGPTAWDADIGCLVVSRETVSGGRAVNQKRREGGLGELEVWVIDVIAASAPATAAEGEGEGESTTATIEAGEQGTRTGAIPLHEHLKGEQDESKLKDLKMGSTAIRQWIKDHPTS